VNPSVRDLWEAGRSVIPVGSGKKALVKWTQYQTTRADEAQLNRWIATSPPIWAVVTGSISGIFTLDFDGPEGCETLRTKLPHLEPHRSTPSGGFHVDFELPDWRVKTLNSSKKALSEPYPHMDVRGEGGYANVLGSADNGDYVWLTDHPPYSIEVLPDELLYLIGKPRPVEDPAIKLCELAIDKVNAGEGRNDSGFWLATQLRDHGLSKEDSRPYLQVFVDLQPETNTKGMIEPYTFEDALASLDQAYARPPREQFLDDNEFACDGIMISNRQLSELTDEAKAAVEDANEPPVLMRRGSAVVRIRLDESIRTEIVTSEIMRNRLCRVSDWYTMGKNGPRNANPPVEVAKNILAEPWPELPCLRDIVETPTLRPDGSLLDHPGYDEATQTWLAPPPGLTFPDVPSDPTDVDLARATELLVDLVREFAFSDDAASQANALGLILTAVLRPAVRGLLPMALITAPIAGSGKTLLANVVSLVATGRSADLSVLPSNDENELKKHLTAALLEGQAIICFDNLCGTFSSPTMSKALTGERWNDRKLGVSKNYSVEQRSLWISTGNNVTLGGDLPRRCFEIRLDPKVSQPWRKPFERVDLPAWVLEHRGELIWACLVIGRAWFARGTPEPELAPWGTFNAWQTVIGGMLSVAHVDGFLSNLETLHSQADPDTALWAALLGYWHQHVDKPVTSLELTALVNGYKDANELPGDLQRSLDHAQGQGSEARRLTTFLREIAGRRFDERGLRVERLGADPHDGRLLWQIVIDE
jgi:hypothetical protein